MDDVNHPLTYRLLWTWDSWLCNPDSEESFVQGYCNLIDWMSQWGYNGLIIWGFLDEQHGGVPAAQAVASYGKARGVRILPGIGAGSYEGFCISRGGPYNLSDYLSANPQLQAINRNSHSPDNSALCLYQQESLDWLKTGARWLAENFDIGGVNIETNESGSIDICEYSSKATEREPNRLKYAASFSDLARAVPVIYDEVKQVYPNAWITYAVYEPAWWHRMEDVSILATIPDQAIAQWNMELETTENEPSPLKHNISLIHCGGWSYQEFAFPPRWGFTQSRCFYPVLQRARLFANNQRNLGMQGFVLGNAGSPAMPDNEINYIAYAEFMRQPDLSIQEFSEIYIHQLYGSNAQFTVLELMLNQEEIHQRYHHTWQAWSSLMFFGSTGTIQLQPASKSEVDAWKSQIKLAEKATAVASESGKQRLGIVLDVLREYQTVCEISRSPKLHPHMEAVTSSEYSLPILLRTCASLFQEYGLFDHTYRYARHLDSFVQQS